MQGSARPHLFPFKELHQDGNVNTERLFFGNYTKLRKGTRWYRFGANFKRISVIEVKVYQRGFFLWFLWIDSDKED